MNMNELEQNRTFQTVGPVVGFLFFWGLVALAAYAVFS